MTRGSKVALNLCWFNSWWHSMIQVSHLLCSPGLYSLKRDQELLKAA